MRPVHHLADLTWPEARATLTPETVVLVPVGAIEAHGPHLPLDTDVVIAAETARRAANFLSERGETLVIGAPVTYGVSYVGACFPGTTPIPAEVLAGLIASVLTELTRWGPRRLAIVNAHLEPAHVAAVQEGVARATAVAGCAVAFPDKRQDRWAATLSEEFRRGSRHAGSYETSLMLAAAPERVRRDLLPGLTPVWIDLPARLRAGATNFAEAGGVEGYFGDPASASADEGERLFDALASMVATAVHELEAPPVARQGAT